ncbi:MAG: dihydrofolate reductase [Alphaproteobacteria bacterium]|nr:dihydrofolate reductase [Alphaproteobacteria bacterium]
MAIVSLIVAAADNNVIGKDNKMPWHIPEDFKYFKKVTLGKPCIMGRKTFESILDMLGKPLPGRTSIVVSRRGYAHEGAKSASSLEEAIEIAKKTVGQETDGEIMILGGAQIYALALEKELVERAYVTRVHQEPEGDAYFPELGPEWQEIERDPYDGFSFTVLECAKT